MKDCGPNLKKYLKKNGMHEGDTAVVMVDDDEDDPFEKEMDDDHSAIFDDKKMKGKKK